jgi:hypothetical protein
MSCCGQIKKSARRLPRKARCGVDAWRPMSFVVVSGANPTFEAHRKTRCTMRILDFCKENAHEFRSLVIGLASRACISICARPQHFVLSPQRILQIHALDFLRLAITRRCCGGVKMRSTQFLRQRIRPADVRGGRRAAVELSPYGERAQLPHHLW